eukprot:2175497-Pyramimonas_sp.AAC.1
MLTRVFLSGMPRFRPLEGEEGFCGCTKKQTQMKQDLYGDARHKPNNLDYYIAYFACTQADEIAYETSSVK